jgi:flagellar basal-body rod protein FlgF
MLLRLQNSFASMADLVRRQEQTANNLANAGTVGFKKDRSFVQTLNERLDAEGSPQSDRLTSQWADMQAGPIEQTGNPLDVAIDGAGFFVLSDENTGAFRYTRAGRFSLGADGMLRAPSGHLVEGQNGPIHIPENAGEITIDEAGNIRANNQQLGTLRIVTFENPAGLRRIEGATFDAGGQEPDDVVEPRVRQGFVEGSNVDPIQEMTEMITIFRLFETQQKTIQTTDQVLSSITRDLGRF